VLSALAGALAALSLGAEATPLAWLPAPPRPLGAHALIAAGEDGASGVLAQGTSLLVWDLRTGRRRLAGRLPNHRWHTLSLAPLTEGESERALVAADRHLVLVHLRTGRLIASWAVPRPSHGRGIAWSPDGARVALVGWELPGLDPSLGRGVPVLWVDAETGTVVSQLRLPEPIELNGVAALGDGRALAIGTPRRLIVLGPGPRDARTIGVQCDQLVGGAREGLVVLRKGALVIVDERSGQTATELARVRAPFDLASGIAMGPGGRWAIGRFATASPSDVVVAIDLARREVVALSHEALGKPRALVPSRDGAIALGAARHRRSLELDLTIGAPEALRAGRVCVVGDCRRGEGTEVDLVRGRRYTGSFRGGEPSGQGVLRYEDGAIYTGPFVRGRAHGAGSLITPSGDERRVRAVEGELTIVP